MAAERAKLAQAGKLDEAEALAVKALAATRELRGELHEEVVISLQILAGLQGAREDWAAARKTLTQVLAIRERRPDRKDWQIGDARRALLDLDRLAAMTRDQRRRLQEADRLNRLQDTLLRQGKYAEGIASCSKAVEIRGEFLGQDHPDYAHSLTTLAWQYLHLATHGFFADGAVLCQPLVQEIHQAGGAAPGAVDRPERPHAGLRAPIRAGGVAQDR